MRVNLKITQIGFILIGIPLVCELLFVGILADRMQHAEIEMKRQAKTKEVLFTAGAIGILAGQAAGHLAGYVKMPNQFFLSKYRHSVKEWLERYDELESLLQDDPNHLKIVRDAKPFALKGIDMMQEIETSVNNGQEGKVFKNPLQIYDVKRMIDHLSAPIGLVMKDYLALAAEGPAREARAREQVLATIAAGVAGNIIVAIFLAWLFTRSVGKRIRRVTDNITRVPKGIPLNVPLKGSDEIARLDRFFHSMVEELEESRKMQRYLIAMVSHDLRSPLTTVSGLLTLLSAGAWGDLSEEARRKVGVAEADINRLISLTNDLLDAERLASGKLELSFSNANVSECILEAIDSVRTFAEQHNVRLEAPAAAEQYADFDQDRIVQVLVNLLSNAIKYSPPNSTVSVEFHCDKQWLSISVLDEGRGVPAEFQQSIFEKFQQVTESDARDKGGKGLGLAICKSIVSQHNGSIGVMSEGGKGSRFWLKIPIRYAGSYSHKINMAEASKSVPSAS